VRQTILSEDISAVDPDFHTDRTSNRTSRDRRVVDISTQVGQWDFAPTKFFCASDFCAVQTTGDTDTRTESTRLTDTLKGHFEYAAECHAALKILNNALCNQLGFNAWTSHFLNSDVKDNLAALHWKETLGCFLTQFFDTGTRTTMNLLYIR
jgi:hypothetical protein